MNFSNPYLAELQEKANKVLLARKRSQYPKKHAPTLPADLLITLPAGGVKGYFNVHKQTVNELVIRIDEDLCFEHAVNVERVLSYVKGLGLEVAIYGWNWRPTRRKGMKLFLKPVAPSGLQ